MRPAGGPEAAPIARRAARRQLEVWGLDDETAFTNELVVSELVGNATRYGAPPLQLRLILDQMLTCEVSDAAPAAPHVKHARTIDESGRGSSSSRASPNNGAPDTPPKAKSSGRNSQPGRWKQAEHPRVRLPGSTRGVAAAPCVPQHATR